MTIKVNGTTVIDNASVSTLKIPGHWYKLTAFSIASASSAQVNLSSYGLNTTTCDYVKYKLVLEDVTTSAAGPTLNLSLHDSSATLLTSTNNRVEPFGGGWTVNNNVASLVLTNGQTFPHHFETVFALPNGYNSNQGGGSTEYDMMYQRYYIRSSVADIKIGATHTKTPMYFTWSLSAGTFATGNLKLYGFIK